MTNLYWITISLTFDENFIYLVPFALILIPLFFGIFYGLATYCFFIIDTKKPLPFKTSTDKETLVLKKGESGEITLTITYSDISDSINTEIKTSHTASTTTNFSDLLISSSRNSSQGNTEEIEITIQASETSLTGNYKVLLGIGNNEVTVSQYVDVIIES